MGVRALSHKDIPQQLEGGWASLEIAATARGRMGERSVHAFPAARAGGIEHRHRLAGLNQAALGAR